MSNFIFEPESNIELESTFEKYARKGPSPRYKVSTVPIKILIRCKGGKICYRTYYVGKRKFSKYKQIAKQQLINKTRMPNYLLYWNEAAPRFKQVKVEGWAAKYLGNTFTKDLAHLSGFVWAHSNHLARFGVQGYSEVLSSSFDNRTGTHSVELNDGTVYKTQMLLGRDGSFLLKTTGKIGPRKLPHTAEIRGKISLIRDNQGVLRRVLEINNIHGYNEEALAGFMEYAQSKFAHISVNTENLSDDEVGMFLLNGFGENIKVTNSLKQEILNELPNLPERIKKWISTSKNLQDIVNALVKYGIVSRQHPIIQKLVQYIRHNTDSKLVFNSVAQNKQNTKSQNTLHAFQLQISADNDYHKGFRRYRKVVG